jgi:protein SCO1/2
MGKTSFQLIFVCLIGLASCCEKAPEAASASTEERMQAARALPPLVPGDVLPDYEFVDSGGNTVHLADYRGSVLAFTFFFTTCPYSNFCPLASKNMEVVQDSLQKSEDAPEKWRLLSITIDPEVDTPAQLKGYAAQYHAQSENWGFLTGDMVKIASLGWQCGLEFWRTNPEQPINHNTRTVVVDAEGRVRWIGTETEWKPEDLVKQMVRAAR